MPNPSSRPLRWFATVALALPLAASAQEAFTSSMLNLRAGPATTFPVVTQLPAGQPLNVIGCIDGFTWCDVALPDGLRGWVSADFLDFNWSGHSVPLVNYGAAIGIPIITFVLGNYWGNFYRDRPWFNEPRWWGHRPPPPPMPGWRPPPPPAPGWSPRPPAPGWRPGPPRPGWQQPPSRPPNWNQPPARPPGWNRPPARPPVVNPPGRPPAVSPPVGRPPGWNQPRPPNMGGPQPPHRPPVGGSRPGTGTLRPSAGELVAPGDRP